jgi:hypothetical protein
MDLAFALINKLRGKDINAPMLDPGVPALTPAVTMTANQKAQEKKNLALLEPSTAAFVKEILVWARANGINALLGETYRSEEDAKKISPTRTAITPGKLDWHQVGRAFHLILKDSHGQLDKAAYQTVGTEVRKRGGEWLGDHVIHGPGGNFVDLAHFEYHPGLVLWQYRKSPLATRELALAEKRAARYG